MNLSQEGGDIEVKIILVSFINTFSHSLAYKLWVLYLILYGWLKLAVSNLFN